MVLPAIPVSTGLRWLGTLWDLARKVHGLLEAQEKSSKAIAALHEEIQTLKLEVERLKALEEVVIARAQAAASTAAASVAMHSTAELARRIGHLEARPSPGRKLPPPDR